MFAKETPKNFVLDRHKEDFDSSKHRNEIDKSKKIPLAERPTHLILTGS